jgi:hypothetical protein
MVKKVIRPLRSEADYEAAIDEIERYFDDEPKPVAPRPIASICWRWSSRITSGSIGRFKKCDDTLTRDRWESFEKIIDGFAGLQIVEQRLHGNSRPMEDRRSVHDVRAARDDRLLHKIRLHLLRMEVFDQTTARGVKASRRPKGRLAHNSI